MEFGSLLLTLIVIGAIWIIKDWFNLGESGPKNLKKLPGPLGLPIVGYFPLVGKEMYRTCMSLGEKYGDIFRMNMGIRKVIVLNSEEAIREAFTKDWAFAGRPQTPTFETFLELPGEENASRFGFRPANSTWRFLRKCAIKALGVFAASKSSHLQVVVDEAQEELEEKIEGFIGKPVEPSDEIFKCVGSVIGRINFGVDMDINSPLLKDSVDLSNRFGKFFETTALMDFIPFGKVIKQGTIRNFASLMRPILSFVEEQIAAHKCSEDVRDVADALERTIKETPESEKAAAKITDMQIKNISQDLFGAGFATTLESFRWALNLLAAHPQIQTKLREEIVSHLGKQKATLDHKDQLPYCEAVLTEVFRCSSLTPFFIAHYTMTSTQLQGFYIPKDHMVLANSFAVHMNPKVFPEPEKFKPERFLTPENSFNTDLAQRIMPFGVGKRRCVGENMARQELFLLIAHTFQKYYVRPATGHLEDPFDCYPGFTRTPAYPKLIFQHAE